MATPTSTAAAADGKAPKDLPEWARQPAKTSSQAQSWLETAELAVGSVCFMPVAVGLAVVSGCTNVCQAVGWLLWPISKPAYYRWQAYFKAFFTILLTIFTQRWSPTEIFVSGDSSMAGKIGLLPDGNLDLSKLDQRAVVMANHQIYTDWLYLWWISYRARLHQALFIVLKESLKGWPIVGWGMSFYNFLFLSRHLETDTARLSAGTKVLNENMYSHQVPGKKATDPMWVMIFPEGTTLSRKYQDKGYSFLADTIFSDQTKKPYAATAVKDELAPLRLLYPRHRGLALILQNLRDSVDHVYDCTIAYSGVGNGVIGEEEFSFAKVILLGKSPKSVHLHFSRLNIADLPLDNDDAFKNWLYTRWVRKNRMLAEFESTNVLIDDSKSDTETVSSAVRLESNFELLHLFMPVIMAVDLIWLVYCLVWTGASSVQVAFGVSVLACVLPIPFYFQSEPRPTTYSKT